MKKLYKWFIGLFHTGRQEVNPVSIKSEQPLEQIITGNNLFQCHYCFKMFELKQSETFPTPVKLCDREEYITGRGVMCPHCEKTCICG